MEYKKYQIFALNDKNISFIVHGPKASPIQRFRGIENAKKHVDNLIKNLDAETNDCLEQMEILLARQRKASKELMDVHDEIVKLKKEFK